MHTLLNGDDGRILVPGVITVHKDIKGLSGFLLDSFCSLQHYLFSPHDLFKNF